MKGLPASGKSTRAKELAAEYGRTVRINKDLLRTMLHFDKWNGRNEKVTHETAKALALGYLKQGLNVIIDDTNLNPKVVQDWKDIAKMANAKIEYQDLSDVDINECIARDATREKRVGKDVIINMALRTGIYKIPNPIVICDLDGTLCNVDHRLHFVKQEKKDWKSFFEALSEDTVRPEVLKALHVAIDEGCSIVFVSGRSSKYKQATLDWLKKNKITFFTTLIMRDASDNRPDEEVKRDILHRYFDREQIAAVIDDRPKVIRMWREEGLQVVDVGSGVEF